jgi:hypothetical protein
VRILLVSLVVVAVACLAGLTAGMLAAVAADR